MNTTKITACLLLLVLPAIVRADSQTDRRVEKAAADSYNYRTVLEDQVKVKANDGVVTLTGRVADPDHRILAEDTVRNLPGVTAVENKITVEPAAPERSDAWIATKIRTKLLLSGSVSVVNTDVAVNDGVVTLTGKAENLAQKELTEVYVAEIEGVASVDNQLSVPKPPSDARTVSDRIDDASITAQVKYALLSHESTSAMRTNVTTKDGVVAIEGEASSNAERTLVTHLASKVRGVKSVKNQMSVKG
ncbi:MAG TPA: BON domain-containing protein [Opitutaceae bacterium]|nr:BON domain-containing protein [Opitutaceae bacterium]